MIELSTMNCVNGGRGRTSGIVCSLTMLLILLFGFHFLNYIPLPGLVGIMMIVVIRTAQWQSIPMLLAFIMGDKWSNIFRFLFFIYSRVLFFFLSTQKSNFFEQIIIMFCKSLAFFFKRIVICGSRWTKLFGL